MQKESENFKQNINEWVQDYNSKIEYLAEYLEEVDDNTNHNYELVLELKDELLEMKSQFLEIKLMLICILEQMKGVKP